MASRSSPDLPVAHVPGRRLPDVARLAWRQGRIRRMISGICGVDEAGRGPLAGSVVAAAVILHPERAIYGLADSKKLSAKRRTQLAQQIRERALAWAVAHASVEEIDRYNILQASLLAMRRAVEALGVVPTEVLIDGVHIPNGLSRPARAIIRGDASVAEISAASILAKTVRDADLVALHQRYPQYGFAQHKGYPTAMHLAALASHGPCAEHRRSFAPVRAVLQQQGVKP